MFYVYILTTFQWLQLVFDKIALGDESAETANSLRATVCTFGHLLDAATCYAIAPQN